MSAQDYGDLSDYLVNGDNYTRVDQGGNTLVIPGQFGQQPLVASDVRNTFWPINNDCPSGNCALFAHEAVTNLYAILDIAGFEPPEENCLCALASMFLSDNTAACQAALQARVDNTTGTPLFDIFPEWILTALGVPDSALAFFDFWFVGCYGALISIPNITIPPRVAATTACYCGYPSFR